MINIKPSSLAVLDSQFKMRKINDAIARLPSFLDQNIDLGRLQYCLSNINDEKVRELLRRLWFFYQFSEPEALILLESIANDDQFDAYEKASRLCDLIS